MVNTRARSSKKMLRRGATLVLSAVFIVAMLGIVAFAIDIGYIMLVRTQLQVAADSAAMAAAAHLGTPLNEIVAAADEYAGYHAAGGKLVEIDPADVELGIWDTDTRRFTPSAEMGNAVRVTARRDASTGGEAPLFFARLFGQGSFSMSASAVAMANPRDIAFVVDLSGSMNDDTEPCWATDEINKTFAQEGYPTVGSELMQQLYTDLGYGAYPGQLEYLGEPWGVRQDKYAYAELTMDGGPLTGSSVPSKYRIEPNDNEFKRKQKAYSAIIDGQIARVMPAALPTPDSGTNYDYWEKYLDYVIYSATVRGRNNDRNDRNNDRNDRNNNRRDRDKKRKDRDKDRKDRNKDRKDRNKDRNKNKNNDRKNKNRNNKNNNRNRGGNNNNNRGGGQSNPSPPSPRTGWVPPGHNPMWYADWAPDSLFAMAPQPAEPLPDNQLAMLPGTMEGLLLPELLFGATPGTPPNNRGTLPPRQDSDRIDRFNNPNRSTFPQANRSVPRGYRNQIGYLTYVQFMMDHGRDLKPDGRTYVSLSRHSADCPWHRETTAAGTFRFPPREQPTHAARRALIAAMNVVKERNSGIGNPDQADWVSIIGFDTLSGGGPVILQSLTADYRAAMQTCTQLQAVGDKGASTATETGLETARLHIRSRAEGGQGRLATNKVVVLLTDGVPNLYSTPAGLINKFMRDNPSDDYYGSGAYWLDAPLMQAAMMEQDKWYVFPVGVGLGTDYDFMDRLARTGGSADDSGQSPRGSGNPAEYEKRLTDIFEEIITNPQVRLVQ